MAKSSRRKRCPTCKRLMPKSLPDGATKVKRKPSAYAQFVKKTMSKLQTSKTLKTSKARFKHVATLWKAHKQLLNQKS